jgi:hypothetical protein
VSEPAPVLDRGAIEEAFRRLGDRLAKRGVVADIYVFGAAMALAYDSSARSQARCVPPAGQGDRTGGTARLGTFCPGLVNSGPPSV